METVGSRIRDLRTLCNMSQEELGKRVGVQRAAINKYEKGLVTNIPITTIEKMADVLGVSPQHLLGWIEAPSAEVLAFEVKVINGVAKSFGNDAVEALHGFIELNTKGKKRVLQYIEDMGRIAQFREDM